MKFRPSAKLQRNEIAIRKLTSPIYRAYWEEPRLRVLVIDELFRGLEAEAFMRDYMILGPVYLREQEFSSAPSYLITLSAPMMRAEDWAWHQFNSNQIWRTEV